MSLVNRYILRQLIVYSATIMLIALAALLLERMLRLLDLTVNSDGMIGYVSQMLLNLIPHYLGIAIPTTFFLAVLLTVSRMSRNSELTALNAAGVGLLRLMYPIMATAILLTAITAILLSVIQPYSRYTHRSLVHDVSYRSLDTALKEGAFVHAGDMTFMAEGRSTMGDILTNVFVFKRNDDGSSTVTTAPKGLLLKDAPELGMSLGLENGVRIDFTKQGSFDRRLSFESFLWPVNIGTLGPFRARGRDERELTLTELWQYRNSAPEKIGKNKIVSEFHVRLVKILSILILPLMAVPLGLNNSRTSQSWGVALGVLVLIVYQKVIELGSALSGVGAASPLVSMWLPFLLFLVVGAGLFYHVSRRVTADPTDWLAHQFGGFASWVQGFFDRAKDGATVARRPQQTR
ncbi:MAG: YjgP/YjgQ family permease [Alphaproteobacteria bacterium]|nr:MAG: YjgP/YjgQ family permease [Alphaproteobacteria bacterium]